LTLGSGAEDGGGGGDRSAASDARSASSFVEPQAQSATHTPMSAARIASRRSIIGTP
jgi:hypothetical protein